MDETYLYQRIAARIRQDILDGRLRPGDRLPAIRELTGEWKCTPGTVQRAYNELATQGLVISQPGRGTHVTTRIDSPGQQSSLPLRRVALVHRAEALLLESVTAGYTLTEIQQAIDLAMDRWRSQQNQPLTKELHALRFDGSHDMAVTWLATHFAEIAPAARLEMHFSGSLGGLIALAEGRCDLAGCHLWDAATDRYTIPFVQKLFPGKHMLLVRLADRRLGLIVQPGNPLKIDTLAAIARPGVRFVNRQPGSGTRVWLDEAFHRLGIDSSHIAGYQVEKNTHSEVAQVVAERQADVGLGLESAAVTFGLDFLPLVEEPYDLVAHASLVENPLFNALLGWLSSPASRAALARLPGYDFSQAGKQVKLDL